MNDGATNPSEALTAPCVGWRLERQFRDLIAADQTRHDSMVCFATAVLTASDAGYTPTASGGT